MGEKKTIICLVWHLSLYWLVCGRKKHGGLNTLGEFVYLKVGSMTSAKSCNFAQE